MRWRPALVGRLLRLVTWPHWTEHRLRSALTVVGVSLGVATVVGVADVNESVLASFRQTVSTVAGASDLEVTSAAGDVDEALIERAAALAGVQAAGGLVESFVPLGDEPGETLYLLGLDFLDSKLWEAQLPRSAVDIPDQVAFLSQADSVVVSRRFAERVHLAEGDALRVVVPTGTRTLRVRGLLADAPAARLFDGMIAVMDLPAAQRALGREGRVDRIAVQVAAAGQIDDVRARLAAALGTGVEVAPPEARGRQVERLLFSLRSMLATASSLAVIVGAFIVFQTVAVSVQQRRRQFALLNMVGVNRRTLVRLCLTETLVLAVLGVALGLCGGWLLAGLASGLVGDTASEIWLQLEVSHRAHSVSGALGGAVIGLVTAVTAAYLAVRATFRASTVEALRPTGVEVEDRRGVAIPVVVALGLMASTWCIAFVPPGLGFLTMVGLIIATQVVAYAGAAVLAPALVAVCGGAWRRVARWSPSLPFRLAAENLPRSPARGGATVATITAAVGMAVTLAGLVQSFEGAWVGWIEQHFGADMFVGSGARFRLLAGPPMSLAIGEDLAHTPGVASVEPFRVLHVQLGDRPIFLQGLSIDDRLAHGGLAMVEGTLAAAAPALRAGTGVLVSDNLATRLGLHRGQPVELPTPAGPRRFRVEGTFIDYLGSLDLGAVAVAHTQLAAIWGDTFANLFRVWLQPGVAPSPVRSAILARLGGSGYYVMTTRQFLDGVRSVLSKFFLATWALEIVAALVGVIGVVNAQLATVLDRGPEIAMVRTIGVRRRDITRAVLLECGALGALGGLSGLALGAMLGAQFVGISLRLVTGWRIPFALPVGPVLASVASAALVSALAGYVPARTAARLEARQRSLD